MSDDITDTLAPSSTQLDAIDLITGPRVFTVKSVDVKKDAEQPVSIHLEEFPRPWKPSKNQRRVLAYCWGEKSAAWAGRRMKLFRDPDVTFGKDKPGGTRIAELSHIDGPKSVPLLISQGRSALYTVHPLTEPALPATNAIPEPTADEVAACADTAKLGAMWRASGAEMRAVIEARVAAIKADAAELDGPLIGGADHA